MADLTAPEVWADWQRAVQDMGQMLSVGSEVYQGGILTLRDVSLTIDMPEASANGTIGVMTFEERGDGTVRITVPPEISFDFTVEPEEGGSGSFTMLLAQTDLETIVSGDPDDLTYRYTAPLIRISAQDLRVEDEPLEMDISFEMTGAQARYRVAGQAERIAEGDFTADTFSANMRGADPEGGAGMLDMSMTMTSLASTSSGTMSALSGMMDMADLIAAGFSSEGTITHGAMVYAMAVREDDGSSFTMTGTTDAGAFDYALGPQGLVYGGSNTGVSFSLASSDIPFPQMNFSMAESAGRFAMPIATSDEPQDFGFLIRMRDLVIDEMLWSMIDPGGALPRDPSTIEIDLSGKANWFLDIMDPEAAETFDGEVPGEIHSLDVNALRLNIAGAELTGDGAFTFDNSDLQTFDGMPAPTGSLNLMLTGANGLIDNLVRMGLVPEDQAMGARMMLGLFARPTGPDSLMSTIEVQPDGAVLANGQRIR